MNKLKFFITSVMCFTNETADKIYVIDLLDIHLL